MFSYSTATQTIEIYDKERNLTYTHSLYIDGHRCDVGVNSDRNFDNNTIMVPYSYSRCLTMDGDGFNYSESGILRYTFDEAENEWHHEMIPVRNAFQDEMIAPPNNNPDHYLVDIDVRNIAIYNQNQILFTCHNKVYLATIDEETRTIAIADSVVKVDVATHHELNRLVLSPDHQYLSLSEYSWEHNQESSCRKDEGVSRIIHLSDTAPWHEVDVKVLALKDAINDIIAKLDSAWVWNGRAKAEKLRAASREINDKMTLEEAFSQAKPALMWQRKCTLFQQKVFNIDRGAPNNLVELTKKFPELGTQVNKVR